VFSKGLFSRPNIFNKIRIAIGITKEMVITIRITTLKRTVTPQAHSCWKT
jgi:hypothetical protein